MSKKSSEPKKILDETEGSVSYYFQYSKDRTQCMLTMISTTPINGTDEILAALQCFVDDAIKDELVLFDGADIDADDGSLH